MGRQRFQAFTSPYVPNTNALIKAARNNEIALWIEVAAEYIVTVALQCFQAFAGAELPQLQCFIIAGADQQPAVTRPCNIADAQLMSGNCFFEFAIICAPDFDELIGSCN